MSIVEDALQKLGKNGHQPGLEAELVADPQAVNSSVAHELYQMRRTAPRRRSWPLLGASAMLVLGGATWWALDRAAPQAPLPFVPVKTGIAPVAAAAPVVVPEPAEAVASAALPVAAPVVVLAPAAAMALLPAPQWLTQGWRLVEQGHATSAMDAWESGLGKLPAKNRLVVYALAQRSLPVALAQARRFGATAPAVVVRETTGSEQSYRVLLLGDAQVGPLAIKNQLLEKAPYLWVAPAPRFDEKVLSADTAVPTSARQVAAATSPAAAQAATATAKPPAPAASGSTVRESSPEIKFSVDDSATLALDALTRGDLAEATRLADILIAQQPGRWEGHFVLGTVLLANGRAREAEAPLDRALGLHPNSARVLLQRAIAAQEAGQPAKAVVWLRQARALAPETPAVWLNLGYSAELSGATDEAVAAYQRYLKLSAGRNGAETQRAYVSERLRVLGKP